MKPFEWRAPQIVTGSIKEGYVLYKPCAIHLNTGFAGNSSIFPRVSIFPETRTKGQVVFLYSWTALHRTLENKG